MTRGERAHGALEVRKLAAVAQERRRVPREVGEVNRKGPWPGARLSPCSPICTRCNRGKQAHNTLYNASDLLQTVQGPLSNANGEVAAGLQYDARQTHVAARECQALAVSGFRATRTERAIVGFQGSIVDNLVRLFRDILNRWHCETPIIFRALDKRGVLRVGRAHALQGANVVVHVKQHGVDGADLFVLRSPPPRVIGDHSGRLGRENVGRRVSSLGSPLPSILSERMASHQSSTTILSITGLCVRGRLRGRSSKKPFLQQCQFAQRTTHIYTHSFRFIPRSPSTALSDPPVVNDDPSTRRR